jgi:hypothetical protein
MKSQKREVTKMTQLKETILEIAIIFAKNFSDALLQSASELSAHLKAISQSSIIESNSPAKRPSEIENPELANLAIGDKVTISVIYRKQTQRYGGTIANIQGDKITVTNAVTGKTWDVAPRQIIYKHLDACEID